MYHITTTENLPTDALLLEGINIIVVRASLTQSERYAAIRCLLPDLSPAGVQALCDQIAVPTVSLDSIPSLL